MVPENLNTSGRKYELDLSEVEEQQSPTISGDFGDSGTMDFIYQSVPQTFVWLPGLRPKVKPLFPKR